MNDTVKLQNRILASAAVLLVAFAAVLVTVSLLPEKRNEPLTEQTPPVEPPESVATHPDIAEQPHVKEESGTLPTLVPETTVPPATETTAAPESTASAPTAVEDVLPDFIAPLSGYVMKGHSTDVQVFSVTMNDYRTHAGVDIAASDGTPVRATAAGVVKEIWEDPMMGHCLSLAHSGGAVSIYKNLAPTLAENLAVGREVSAGTVLGTVGESARIEIADASHLHYELEIDGVSVDPADFMLLPSEDTAYEG